MSRLEKYVLYETNDYEGGPTRSQEISQERFYDILHTKCKNSIDTPLYRGIRRGNRNDFMFVAPSKYIRRSEYTENWYMLLFQLLPEWKKFPNLSKSIICSSSKSGASSWGSCYEVYPFDNSILAVTPNIHLWASFEKYYGGMNDVNTLIEDLMAMLGAYLTYSDIYVESTETNPSVLMKMFETIDRNKSDMKTDFEKLIANSYIISSNYDLNIVVRSYMDGNINTILDLFAETLSPKRFLLKNSGDNLPIGKQVWTEGNCILKRIGE